MKIFILILFLLSSFLYADELSWVDKQINAIKPPRLGISDKDINQLKDPFIFIKKSKLKRITKNNFVKYHKRVHHYHKYHSKKINIDAIFNNTVMINKKWYKEGSYIDGYKIIKIQHRSIILKKNTKNLILSTYSKNKNLKFNNK